VKTDDEPPPEDTALALLWHAIIAEPKAALPSPAGENLLDSTPAKQSSYVSEP